MRLLRNLFREKYECLMHNILWNCRFCFSFLSLLLPIRPFSQDFSAHMMELESNFHFNQLDVSRQKLVQFGNITNYWSTTISSLWKYIFSITLKEIYNHSYFEESLTKAIVSSLTKLFKGGLKIGFNIGKQMWGLIGVRKDLSIN